MILAKEKAKQLFDKMADTIQYNGRMKNTALESYAKECALICADEVVKQLENIDIPNRFSTLEQRKYWTEVKEEIKNI